MSTIRTVFLGTPEFARFALEKLIDDEHFEVVGVVTQPDRPAGRKMKLTPSPVRTLAEEKGLPLIATEKVSAPEILEQVKQWKAEAAIVVAFGQIVSQEFLDLYPSRVVNVHASLLPRWRGAAPIQRAIVSGDKETGVSLQVMVKELDAGDVIGVKRISLEPMPTAVELHDQLKVLGAEILQVEFMDYLRGNLAPVAQDESLVTYAKKIEKSEGLIDWSKSAVEIRNHIYGMSMGPGGYTTVAGKKLKIHKCEPVMGADSPAKPGQVVVSTADSLTVASGEGELKILELQPESRARMKIEDYQKGYAAKEGDIWGE